MNKTQKALKLAIEQMQHLIKIYIPSPEWSGTAIQEDCYETIKACKEALAQPAQEQAKADFDVMAYGQSFMLDGKHIPLSNVYTQPAQEPVARIEVFNLLTKNGAFAIKEEWLWNIRYINSKGIIREFPNEYPSEKKYAIQSAKYWADFLNCKIVEVDNRGNK